MAFLNIKHPPSPQTSYLAIYLTVLLGATALAVVLTTFLLRLYHKPDHEKVWASVKMFTRITQIILCIKCCDSKKKTGKNTAKYSTKDKSETLEKGDVGEGENGGHPINYVGGPSPWARNGSVAAAGGVDVDVVDVGGEEEEQMTWKDVAKTMDWLCFVSFSLFILASSCLTMAAMVRGGADARDNMDAATTYDAPQCMAGQFQVGG